MSIVCTKFKSTWKLAIKNHIEIRCERELISSLLNSYAVSHQGSQVASQSACKKAFVIVGKMPHPPLSVLQASQHPSSSFLPWPWNSQSGHAWLRTLQ